MENKESIKPEYKTPVRSNTNIGSNTNMGYTSVSKKKEPEKVFKPSPVISPVYGVLDKNYTKEEIRERNEYVRHNPGEMNYDSVRRKAYGTLEDELENTLTKISANQIENKEEKDDSKSIEDLLSEIESNKNISIGELEERQKDK